ncbi:MAG: hypothetical protein LiPW30_376 [Parcubacteria group bacterium LiPW_30]|jgi:cell division protein FtsB|nr:MAG: hypothetical protein LiPW30_376 [Parcubacteria group bacterium LiPW_30]
MLEFQDKKRFRRILYSRVTFVLVFILCVFVGRAAVSMYKSDSLTGEKRKIAEDELVAVRARENSLKAQIISLKTERGVEEELRGKFRVVKNGEGVIIVVDQEKKEATTTKSGFANFFKWFLK